MTPLVLTITNALALAAHTLPWSVLAAVGICLSHEMAVNASTAIAEDNTRRSTAHGVFSASHRLKMCGVDTRAARAAACLHMVDFHAFRDRTNGKLVSKAMGAHQTSTRAEFSVAIWAQPRFPQPAPFSLLYLRPKPLFIGQVTREGRSAFVAGVVATLANTSARIVHLLELIARQFAVALSAGLCRGGGILTRHKLNLLDRLGECRTPDAGRRRGAFCCSNYSMGRP